MPTARQELSCVAVEGILLVPGIVAAVAQSWAAFRFLVLVLLVAAWHSGEIRPDRRLR